MFWRFGSDIVPTLRQNDPIFLPVTRLENVSAACRNYPVVSHLQMSERHLKQQSFARQLSPPLI